MYDRRAGFVRATKEADGDFCAFGNAVITREVVDYRASALSAPGTCATSPGTRTSPASSTGALQLEAAGAPAARSSARPKTALGISAPKVAELKNEEAFKEIKCRRILLPADEYDLPAPRRAACRGSRSMSTSRTSTSWRSRAAHLPGDDPALGIRRLAVRQPIRLFAAVVYGLPDARMLQQMMLSMLEASEKATNPPMIAVGEAINGASTSTPPASRRPMPTTTSAPARCCARSRCSSTASSTAPSRWSGSRPRSTTAFSCRRSASRRSPRK
jgi:hypothetical protein